MDENEIKDTVTQGYRNVLKRDPDPGGLSNYINEIKNGLSIERFYHILRTSEEYRQKFGGQQSSIIHVPSSSQNTPNTITYCMIGGNKLHEIKDYIPTVLPYVDKLVYVDSGSTDGTIEFLKDLSSKNNDKIDVIVREWQDKFSYFRNFYLEHLRNQNYNGLVLTSDSVSGNRCTTILNEDGEIEVLSFEELYNKYTLANWDIISKDGKEIILNPDIKVLSCIKPKIFIAKKIDDLRFFPDDMDYLLTDKQIEILKYYKKGYSYQKIGEILDVHWNNIVRTRLRSLLNKIFVINKPEWYKVSKIIRHKTNKDLVQITTKHGGTCVTRDHSLIDIKIGKFPVIERDDDWFVKAYKGLYVKIIPEEFIKNNRSFVSIHNINNDKIIEEIDLAKYINDWSKLFIDDEGDYICFYRKYDDKLSKIKRFYTNDDIKILCEVLGSFISEGSTTGNQTFSIANNNKDWLDKIKVNLEKITIDCRFTFVENEGTYNLRSYQNLLIEIFENLCGDDASRKKIPNFIYNIQTEYKQIFLENLIKGDGWKNKEYFLEQGNSLNYAENRFEYTTTSLKLASGLSTLLKLLYINHHIYRGINNIGIKYYVLGSKTSYKEKVECHMMIENINSDNKDIHVYDLEVENSNIFVDSLGSILLHNTDEHYPPETLSQLRNLIDGTHNGIQFRAYDITIDDNDRTKIVSESLSNYWKGLMFEFHQNLRYEGEPHESLVGTPINWRQTDLIYKHIRSQLKIYYRATENFFISNSNRYSSKWGEFRMLCGKNGMMMFAQFIERYKKGGLPKEIEDWIYNHRDDNSDSGDSEVREMAKLYYEILHPNKRQSTKIDKQTIKL